MEEDKARKTVSFTHRQLGVGGISLMAALTALGPLKDYVYTRNEALLQNQRVERVEVMLSALEMKITDRMNRNTDKIMDRIKEAEDRAVKTADHVEHRVESLEVAMRFKVRSNN